MTHSSPSRTAVVFSEARSLPEFGSENPWHHRVSPFRMPGRNSFFCSSVPHCRMVGPTSVSPKKSPRIGAFARANSSASATPCIVVSPLPPYSSGHVAQIHPPSNSFWGHSALNCLRSSSDISKSSSNQPSGRLASSHPRISVRNSSASFGYVKSIGTVLQVTRARHQARPSLDGGSPVTRRFIGRSHSAHHAERQCS